MSDYLYFLSYARSDRDQDKYNSIRKFSGELEQEVRMLTGSVHGNVGFFDGEDIEPENVRPDAQSEALCTSRVFVPIYSPTYFAQENCGREWKIFRDRLEAYKKQNPAAEVENLIQPVLLVPPDRLRLPDPVSDIQYLYHRYPEDYRKEGLDVISRVGAYKDSYEMFKTALARRIVEVAEKYPLPPLNPRPDIEQIRSIFHQPGPQIPDTNGISETGGPRYVQFIFVAGKRDELQQIRESLEHYGDKGGSDWKPFLPVTGEVWEFATEVALKDRLLPEVVPLDVGIIERLEEAEQNHKIVVVIVDAWSLRLQRYRTLMRLLDERDFLNCVVLVLWNRQDNETLLSRPELENAIQAAFPNKSIVRDPNRFLDSIEPLDELKKQLSDAMHKAHARIVQKMEVVKRVQGVRQIPRPIIEGPGV